MEPKDFVAACLEIAEQVTDPDEREDAIHWLHEKYKKYESKGKSSGKKVSSPDVKP